MVRANVTTIIAPRKKDNTATEAPATPQNSMQTTTKISEPR